MLISPPIPPSSLTPAPDRLPIDLAIAAWLDAKAKRSGSTRTARAYADTIADFRAVLISSGLDLDSDPRPVSLTAQAYAGNRKDGTHESVSASTYNQKLAIISSFYAYARKQGLLDLDNPIARVERRAAHAYQHAQPLDTIDVARRMKAIDRTSIEGKRDYALLTVALGTGRRVVELANLRRADLYISATQLVTVTFQRTKGGKTASDTLSSAASRVLIEYLYTAYGADFLNRPTDAPIWGSISDRNKGKAIGVQTIADICERRLGTSKVHTLRHTYAHMMQADGAAPSLIQAKLGHESLATTGRYLAALTRADNPHADALSRALGIE